VLLVLLSWVRCRDVRIKTRSNWLPLVVAAIGVVAALAPTAPAQAASTIEVPRDEPTIQAAINAAVSGDTILVSQIGNGGPATAAERERRGANVRWS